jgi:hypothetical protein
MKIVIMCLCIALLSSCTSEPLNVRYYLLHTPENEVSRTSDDSKPSVVLQLINVADYLRQSSLVMQVGQHELHYSRQDVWAEELQTSFYNALLQELNISSQQNYVALTAPNASLATTSITITLKHFHVTDVSTVVASGQYWLSANNALLNKLESTPISSHAFFFELDLKQDGYAHAVEQLRALITNLATQIEKDITALPNN